MSKMRLAASKVVFLLREMMDDDELMDILDERKVRAHEFEGTFGELVKDIFRDLNELASQ